jgi:tetratricopeptide (TPR) repeat protein
LLPYQFESPGEHAVFFGALAQAHYEAGELEKAREEYERIISLSAGRIAHGDIYAKSFYMLGKIAERQDERAEAAENYRKFLELWKDADHGRPEVDDARKRLTNLK